MKALSLILITPLILIGCDLDSSNSQTTVDYKAELVGSWRSSQSSQVHYLDINQDNFQQGIAIESIDCQARLIDQPYEADESQIITNEQLFNYSLAEDRLTITDTDNVSFVYERDSEARPDICHAPELEGAWDNEEHFGDRQSAFKNNQYRIYYERELLSCLQKSVEWDYAAHNGKIALKNFNEDSTPDTYEHIFNYTLENEELALYFNQNDPDMLQPDLAIKVSEPSINLCEDENSSKEIEIKITLNSIPANIETYLQSLAGDYSNFETKLTFDMDQSDSLSSKDIIVSLKSQSKIKADGSHVQLTEASLIAKVVDGRSSYDQEFDLAGFTINENTMAFTIRAADIGWINNINSTTPINVSSTVYNGARITDGADNFYMTPQHTDYYPAENAFTSGVDITLLEDMQNDVAGNSNDGVIVDIYTVEILISE